MKVLVAHGSKMGATEEIARAIGAKLSTLGWSVTVADAGEVHEPLRYDAMVIGSALYAGRWTGRTARLVKHVAHDGFTGPVWLFQSGPLGDEDAHDAQPFPKKVLTAAAQLDVRDMATFGGRLQEHPDQFIARAMAKNLAGDWRDWEEIDAWAVSISDALGMYHAA